MQPIVYIIIPAKNEADRIGNVLQEVKQEGFENIVVVDDGSTDHTGSIAQSFGVTVLTHVVNLGAGAATQTGIEYALDQGADIIVTFDGDGQHYADDIQKLLEPLGQETLDVVLGSRFLAPDSGIPSSRILYNRLGNVVTKLIAGLSVSDSQTGMKAFRADFGRKLRFQFNGYEFCTEFIYILRKSEANYKEVPIKVRYTQETLRKGQSLLNGFRMILRLVKHYV